MTLDLTALEARILGALIEKEITTPDYYPLTLNSLLAACNQKNNRHPEMQLTADELGKGIVSLQYDKKLVATFSGAGSRSIKYVHRLAEVMGLDSAEIAIMAELLLRGPQTAGELRARASRMAPFETAAQVREVLDELAARQPDAYVVELPRQPGTKENRFMHTWGDASTLQAMLDDSAECPATGGRLDAVAPPLPPAVESALRDETRIKALEARVEILENTLKRLSDFVDQFN